MNKKVNRADKLLCVLSIIWGLVGVLTHIFLRSSLSQDRYQGLNVSLFSLSNVSIFVLYVVACFCIMKKVSMVVTNIKVYDENKDEHKAVFWISFFLNLLCWGIWFWLYFPGAGMNDTINCIISFHNDNQPLVYQVIIYFGMKGLMHLTSSMTISYAFLVAMQMVLMSAIIAWIAKWLYMKKVRSLIINLFIAYYAFMPVVADYSITLVKDSLFGICMMALIPLLYDIVSGNGEIIREKRFNVIFLLVLFGINVFRSNGKYIVFILLILFLILFKNKRFYLAVLVFMMIINSIVSYGEKRFIVGDATFRESISVPLVQIGAVLTADGYISDENKEVLSNVLPLDTWEERYCFWFSDSIKFNENFNNEWLNEHKAIFISTWFSILKDNLEIYVKSYLCHTYGLWNISPFNPTDFSQSFFTRINNNTGDDSWQGQFCINNALNNRDINPGTLSEYLNDFFNKAFCVGLIFRPGIMFWFCMGLMVILCIYKKSQMCCIFLPIILNWIIMMIASPASYIYRYSFYLFLSIPILFAITLMEVNKRKNK